LERWVNDRKEIFKIHGTELDSQQMSLQASLAPSDMVKILHVIKLAVTKDEG
jgi:aspartate carbamoyltransferase regulatory subunit